MTITLQAVNELIASLESAGELSIREQKFLKLAKAFKQLAAENVELKQSERELDKTCAEEFGQDWVSEFTETPATDRIVAEAEARGVEKFAAHLRANYNGASVCKIIALGADDFAKQLREGADK
ncbi:hypothetical protein [Klebsiella pneumoniae]|uniref:hypothetical protein n=1 Tax=Klebsiella pneumoniae TaxID=573 RepID=UPI00300DF657